MLKQNFTDELVMLELKRKGIPVEEMQQLQLISAIQLRLNDYGKCVLFRYQQKLTNFLLMLGPSGHGKTSAALSLCKYFNDLMGFDWDVKRYFHLGRDTQLTGAYIASKFERGEFIIVDEFHLIAPSMGESKVQVRDINQFLNTIRRAGIGLFALSQYRTDLHTSVHNKFDFRFYCTYNDHLKEQVNGRIELKILEESGDWRVGWSDFQLATLPWCKTSDLEYADMLKDLGVLSERSEAASYVDKKRRRILGLIAESSETIFDLYAEGFLSEEFSENKIQIDVRTTKFAYAALYVGVPKSIMQASLRISSGKYGLMGRAESQFGLDERDNVIDPVVKLILLEAYERLKEERGLEGDDYENEIKALPVREKQKRRRKRYKDV